MTTSQEIAMGMFTGSIFTSLDIPRYEMENLSLIFMPIMFLSQEQRDEMTKGDDPVCMMWEYRHKAGPMGINGYPVFMSMNVVRKSQLDEIIDLYKKLKAATDSVLKGD